MMWSVEVGIQRRRAGHKDLVVDDLAAIAVAVGVDEMASSAIVGNK